MADRRVGEHALDVGLHDGEERPDEERQDGEDPDRRPPVVAVERQGDDEDPQQGGEGGHLADRGHERRHRRRCPLVDVRGPEVERHGGDLEAEPDEQEGDTGEDEGVVALDRDRAGQRADHRRDVRRPDGAVDEGDAVQQERRREAAEHEVLEAALRAAGFAAVAGGEHVEGQRHRLQTDEQDDQVVRRAHHDGAGGGDEVEGVDLRPVHPLAGEVVVADEGDQQQAGADGDRHEHGEAVEGEGAADQRARALVADVVPEDHRQHPGGTGRGRRDDRVPALRPARREGADDEQEQGDGDEDEQRREREPADLGPDERCVVLLEEHHPPPSSTSSGSGSGMTSPVRASTCSIRRSTLGSMRSSSGRG